MTATDIARFCGDQRRFSRPVTRGGWTYATDNCLAVRVPAIALIGDDPEIVGVDRLDAWNQFAADEAWPAWPGPDFIEEELDCPECDGRKIVNDGVCHLCDGVGSYECDSCGQDVDCKVCNKTGRLGGEPCKACNGSGRRMVPWLQRVGVAAIDLKYDAKIRSLPGVRWRSGRVFGVSATDAYAMFVFDGGGQGAIMYRRVNND